MPASLQKGRISELSSDRRGESDGERKEAGNWAFGGQDFLVCRGREVRGGSGRGESRDCYETRVGSVWLRSATNIVSA